MTGDGCHLTFRMLTAAAGLGIIFVLRAVIATVLTACRRRAIATRMRTLVCFFCHFGRSLLIKIEPFCCSRRWQPCGNRHDRSGR